MKIFPKRTGKCSQKLGTSALTSVNVLQSNPYIIGTESVTDDGSDLTITVNGLKNRVMTRTTALAMEQKRLRIWTRVQEGRPRTQTSLVLWLLHISLLSYAHAPLFSERKSVEQLFI